MGCKKLYEYTIVHWNAVSFPTVRYFVEFPFLAIINANTFIFALLFTSKPEFAEVKSILSVFVYFGELNQCAFVKNGYVGTSIIQFY